MTAIEFRLFPLVEVYAGMMVWDWEQAREVLDRWVAWTRDAPEEITSAARIIQIPPLPDIPEPLRGRSVVVEHVAALVAGYLGRLTDTLAPYDAGTRYTNFVESATELENIFPADTLRRLEAVKAQVDPNGLFQANHEIHS